MGIAIAALCVLAFLVTWVFPSDVPDVSAWSDFKTYYAQHRYLKLPELARDDLLDDAEAPAEGESAETAPPPEEQRRAEQAELDRLFERVLEQIAGPMRRWSLVPARGLAQAGWLTSFFLHFGWMHLLGNLLFLYIVAPLLEDAWGRLRFLVFYVAGGLIANLAQYALAPHAQVAIAGASGAIAACMGAFSIRFAVQRVRMFYFVWMFRIWAGTAMVPAWICGAAWFGFELLDLRKGGAEGVATGAHVGGFVLGAFVALGMKALGFEKALRTAEEAELDTRHKADLMQDASVAAARGELELAKEQLTELLRLMPGREDAELLLAKVDLRLGNGTARLERALRKLLAKRDDAALVGALLEVWPDLEPSAFSTAFALQLAKHLEPMRNPRVEPLLEPLLRHAATAGGRFAADAERLLGAQGPAPAPAAPPAVEQDVQVNAVAFAAVSPQGLSLIAADGQQRTVPFERIVLVHAAVAPVAGRRVLFVDLLVRRAPPLALRLTSDDAGVPALFPGTPLPQAWKTFVDKLVGTSRAKRVPAEGFATLESAEQLGEALRAAAAYGPSTRT